MNMATFVQDPPFVAGIDPFAMVKTVEYVD
jgi:hypothetical protein